MRGLMEETVSRSLTGRTGAQASSGWSAGAHALPTLCKPVACCECQDADREHWPRSQGGWAQPPNASFKQVRQTLLDTTYWSWAELSHLPRYSQLCFEIKPFKTKTIQYSIFKTLCYCTQRARGGVKRQKTKPLPQGQLNLRFRSTNSLNPQEELANAQHKFLILFLLNLFRLFPPPPSPDEASSSDTNPTHQLQKLKRDTHNKSPLRKKK